jgi:PST family polysaccharide transporter
MRARAASGAAFTSAAQIYRMGISFGSGVLLARLLTPADFGLIAMFSTCVSLIVGIQDLGLNQAIIQRPMITKAQVSALFWLSLGFSVVLAVTLALSAPAIVWFYDDSTVHQSTAKIIR